MFRAARDLLVECQTDYERARAEFEWPRFEHFNFGFDWFDRLAQDPACPTWTCCACGTASNRSSVPGSTRSRTTCRPACGHT
ncbi:hypothetical protein MICRO116_930001 [Micrococcus sp. 116]|nr:hypothetical protein MICRO116_930001 [Micrococcus sp. 116]